MNARILTVGAMAGLLVAAFGCQIIVGSDPPPFSCEEGKAGACPSGQFCSGGVCVSGTATDTAVDPDVAVPPDAPTDLDGGADVRDASDGNTSGQLGSRCSVNKDCTSGLCGTDSIMSVPAFEANGGSVCTKICCTSNDCDRGFVCLNTGTGGSYCVSAAKVLPERELPATGGKAGGVTCTTNVECRSGLCGDVADGGVKRCVDNCCSQGDCATDSVCALTSIGGKYLGFVCTDERGTLRNPGTACTTDSQCKSNLCYDGTQCVQHCAASKDCPATQACVWLPRSTTDTRPVNVCNGEGTRADAGTTCATYEDCKSTQCEPRIDGQPDAGPGNVCRDLCNRDSDCPAPLRCLPAAPTPGPRVLRCVPG